MPLQFDFINPGAKNLALGGAFAGLADDATATYVNPAGLPQLGASEFSLEARSFRVSTPFLESGRLSGIATNQGVDTTQGAVFGESIGRDTGVGFAAGVYLSPGRRWAMAGHRHELVRIDQSFFSQGVFQKAPEEFTSYRDSPLNGSRVMSVTGYGASGAFKLRADLSVGATFSVYRFNLDSSYRRFDIAGFLGPPVLTREFQLTTQQGRDTAVAPTVGLMYGAGDLGAGGWLRRVKLGLVYRHGPSFQYATQGEGLPAIDRLRFRVPHSVAVGASIRVQPQLLVAGEVTRLGYSRLIGDFVADQARGDDRQADFRVDDGTELRVGVQYALPSVRGVPRLRAGAWFDPDHSVKFSPQQPATTVPARLYNERVSAALSKGRGQLHITGGVGLTLHRRIELNAGTDISPRQVRVSTSMVVR